MNVLGSALTSITPRKDDTIMDRLNYYYSSMIIIGISLTLTAKQYVGHPIQCWVPAEFSKAWEQYAENYCFVYNTYWVRPDEEVPIEVDARVNRQLLYYQWVPFLMALEAGFFYLPVVFWSQMNKRSGLKIAAMVEAVEHARGSGKQSAERRKAVLTISQHMEETVHLRQMRKQSIPAAASKMEFKMGIYSGGYVANMYLVTKLLFILNIIGQFLAMNMFLGQNDPFWGIHIFWDIINGLNWELSGNFPRVALCDFSVRTLSNIQRYSIQCVLILNMFNEKIFLFLYWWFLLIGLMTLVDAIIWALNTRISARRIAFMKRFINVHYEEDYLFREFCDRVIGPDGTILLRIIGKNGNELFTQEVLEVLWDGYRAGSQLRHVLAVAHQKTPRNSLPTRRRRSSAVTSEIRENRRNIRRSLLGSSSAQSNNLSADEHHNSRSLRSEEEGEALLTDATAEAQPIPTPQQEAAQQ